MRRRPVVPTSALALVAGLLLTVGAGSSPAAATGERTLRQRATVVKVVDGDTVDARLRSGREKRVRLIGIDTPEVYDVVECGGPQASRSLERLLPVGTRVRLVSDPTQDRVDQYGRILRYVVRASTGRDMNRAQVRRGWAPVYVYNRTPFTRVDRYYRAQDAARAQGRGIWGRC